MMKHAGDGAADPGIEVFYRIFAVGMPVAGRPRSDPGKPN